MNGQTLSLQSHDGHGFDAYISFPPGHKGPGLLVLQEIFGVNDHIRSICDYFAEEGYIALAPDMFWRVEPGVELGYTPPDIEKALGIRSQFDEDLASEDMGTSIDFLRALDGSTGRVGAIGFCMGGKLAYLAGTRAGADCAVSYYGVGIEHSLDEADQLKCPMVFHFPGLDQHVSPEAVARIERAFATRDAVESFHYPEADHGFNCDQRPSHSKTNSLMAHSRTIALLRRAIGPTFKLDQLWDEHCACEFETRDAAATMATMVAQPYVNHIPTLTGGVGYKDLYRFYKHHFIPRTPQDTKLTPVSRTIGADRIVDEMVFSFTHDIEIDWMLPGIAPTGKFVEVPLVAIVSFRGGKLFNEHIYWDQASVLVQLGLLDPDGLPVAGKESAAKLLEPSLPSNHVMARWTESEDLD